jgi:hypothetical protein
MVEYDVLSPRIKTCAKRCSKNHIERDCVLEKHESTIDIKLGREKNKFYFMENKEIPQIGRKKE